MHYLIVIIMLSCPVSFHVLVTKQDSVWQIEGWISNINSLFIPKCDILGIYYISALHWSLCVGVCSRSSERKNQGSFA